MRCKGLNGPGVSIELSVFLASVSAFSFLVLASPLIGAVLAGQNLYLLFAAPLLASGIAGLYCHGRVSDLKCNYRWALVGFIFSILLFFALMQWAHLKIYGGLPSSSLIEYEDTLYAHMGIFHSFTLFVLALPFFFYGVYIVSAFQISQTNKIVKIYIYEVIGIGAGYISAGVILDHLGFNAVVIGLFTCAGGALILQRTLAKKLVLPFVGGLVISLYIWPHLLQPSTNVNFLARDYFKETEVKLINSGWTTFSSVQTLEQVYPSGKKLIRVSLSGGVGQAVVFLRGSHLRNDPGEVASLFKPKKVLVLFAGGGADIVVIKSMLSSDVDITGVELNGELLRQVQTIPDALLTEVIKNNSSIRLVQSENRRFLESTEEKFDLILYSWSGATTAHYSGAVLHTTQYSFTQEGLSSAYSRLNDGGHMVIFGGSKVNLITSFFSIFNEQQLGPLQESLLLISLGEKAENRWKSIWDDYVLVVKKGKFSKKEVLDLKIDLVKQKKSLEIAPFISSSQELKDVESYVGSDGSESALSRIRDIAGMHFDSHSDDRPFVYNSEFPRSLGSFDYWKTLFAELFSAPSLKNREQIFLFLLIILFLVGAYGMAYVRVSKVLALAISMQSAVLGIVSTSLVVLATYKIILIVGNPTWSFIICQLTVLVGGALGAWLFYTKKASRLVFYGLGVLTLCGITLWGYIFMNGSSSHFMFGSFGLPAILMSLAGPVTFTSYSYAGILKKSKEKSTDFVAILFSLNLLAAAFAAVFVPVSVENLGYVKTSILPYSLLLLLLFLHLCYFGLSYCLSREKLKIDYS